MQLAHRLAAPLIRHVLEKFRTQQLRATAAAVALGLSRSGFYKLYSGYLKAFGPGRHAQWSPGTSGGNHAAAWPAEVTELLRKRLSSQPPAPYSFAASEAMRLCGFKLHRAQVRRWASEHGLAHAIAVERPKAPVRRWQRSAIGELWQLDASPHRWFPGLKVAFPLLNLLDDCSRLLLGSKLYQRELLLAYLDFLPEAFWSYGLPLEIYVDYHSLFFTATPDALTQLGQALHFYGVSFRYAPTPQAKGKIERAHHYWQQRLPAYFASETIRDLEAANAHLQALRLHRNQHEVHRELGRTPQAAWETARQDKRSALRKAPRCPWWPYVWSERKLLKVTADGRVPIGGQAVRLEVAPGTRVVLCHHPCGHYTVLRSAPDRKTKPVVLFTNRPH